MAQPKAYWNGLYSAFEPNEILAGERSSLYCDREYSRLPELKQVFDRAQEPLRPPIAFFTGHRGSGKSSTLFQLLGYFQADYFLVYVDIEYNLDSAKANQIDLLYLLGMALYQAAVQEGLTPETKYLEALADCVNSITLTEKENPIGGTVNVAELAKNLIVFGANALGSKLGEKLAEALLKPVSITSGVSEEIARSRTIEPRVQEMVAHINLLIADVETKAGKPVFIIVDGLDKLERIEQAKLLFLESRALRGPLCRILYTVPMLIYMSPLFQPTSEESEAFLLPNIKVFERLHPGHPYTEGLRQMREVVEKRLQLLALKEEAVFEAGTLDRLIHFSGGVMRLLIRLVRDACRAADRKQKEKVDMQAVQEATQAMRKGMAFGLTIEDMAELKRVRESHRPSSNPLCQTLLHALYILAYENDEPWYEVHPLLWDVLDRVA